MSVLVFLLYLSAAAMAGYVVYYRVSAPVLALCLASIFLMFESQGWFLTFLFDGATEWPVHSVMDTLALSVQGVSTPTTLSELVVVAIGRLIILLGIFYLAVFAVKRGNGVVARIQNMTTPNLVCLMLWVVCLMIDLTVQALAISSLLPLGAVARALGAVAAAALSFNIFMPFIRSPRASGSGLPPQT